MENKVRVWLENGVHSARGDRVSDSLWNLDDEEWDYQKHSWM